MYNPSLGKPTAHSTLLCIQGYFINGLTIGAIVAKIHRKENGAV